MGKKKELLILKGSLRFHWMKHILNYDIYLNRCNQHGFKNAMELYKRIHNLDPRVVPPEFDWKIEEFQWDLRDEGIFANNWLSRPGFPWPDPECSMLVGCNTPCRPSILRCFHLEWSTAPIGSFGEAFQRVCA